jgi:protein-tyrosine phosphatase
MKILFVCSGNVCRSPMAAAYFRHRAPDENLGHVVADSAGTLGIEGAPASDEAIRVLDEIGIDLRAHRSRGIRDTDVRTSDFIVAMSYEHLDFLAETFPRGGGRRLLLRAFEGGSVPSSHALGLDDPMGRSLRVYRGQLPLIRRCIDHLLLHLKHVS